MIDAEYSFLATQRGDLDAKIEFWTEKFNEVKARMKEVLNEVPIADVPTQPTQTTPTPLTTKIDDVTNDPALLEKVAKKLDKTTKKTA